MKTNQRFFAWLVTLIMLLGMLPAATAELADSVDMVNCSHVWDAGRWLSGAPSNCCDSKIKRYTCTKCGMISDFTEYGKCIPGSKVWIHPQGSNCLQFGVWEITCKYCGEWLDGREEPGPHKWVTRVVQEPGCTWPGLKETICSVCGSEPNTPYEEIPELGHDWGDWHWAHGYEANCAQGAWQVRDCKRCSAQEDRWIGPGAHSWGEWKWQSGGAFCTDEGTEVRTCSKCGATEERPAPGSKHSWGEWKWRGGVPSCEKTGIQSRICTKCGMTEEREVAGGNHNWGEWKVYEAPTCLEKGIEHRQCSICGQYWTREMGALGHEMGEWITIKQPTADENGLKERKCVRCDYTEQEEIPYNYGDIEYAFASLSKREASAPANGECYTLGETVLYSVIFTVPEGLTLLDVEITDPIKGNNEDAVLDIIPEADGGEYTYSVSHVVTETDIENGFVSNIATAYFFDPEGDAWVSVSSNEVTVLTGEDDNSAVILEKIDMRGPANGEYYVPGETIKYGLTVRSDENNPLENIVIYDPLKGGDQIVFGPADSWVLGAGFDYTVTEADAQRGYIENTGYATFTYQNTGKEDTVYSNTLILPCGTAEASYITAIDLELVGLPAAENVKPGDVLKVKLKVTNTGETTVTLNSSSRRAANGESFVDAGTMRWNKYQSDPLFSWFMAGNSLTSDLDITVTESHIADGEIRFTFTQYAEPFYVVVNGVETDIPADIVPTPEGVTGRYGKDEEEVSDSVEIVIPLTNGSDELKDVRFTKHLRSTPANGEFFVPGEVIKFWLSLNILDSEGNIIDIFDSEGNYSDEGCVYDYRVYDPLTHGQNIALHLRRVYSLGFSVNYIVTEEDAQRGYVENTAYVTFSYTEGGETVRVDSNTVTAPCGPGELPDDYQDPGSVMLTLIEWSEPDNGTHYVPGEKINVYHRISNNSRDVTMTMDHQHFFEICGDGIKEKDDSLYSKVLLPGTSYGVYFWGPTVTEADAARGYVERTTTFYLMGDDGNEYTATGSVRLPCGPGELPDDYVPPVDPDIDGDGIPNEEDPDIDGDGIPNGEDPDVDGDGIPNGSDPDADGDGIPNGDDPDVDGDGTPNGDDSDVDGDGTSNGDDSDVDGDGTPNGSDPDVDGDGTPNGEDPDVDGDGVPNGGDPDIDGDGIPNEEDPDMDGDGIANEDDPDADGDGIPDEDGDFGLSDCLTLVKTLLSTPANGNYFVPGEEVEYSVLVKNTGDALTGLVVSDWMWDAPRSFGDIQKGEDVTYPVNYTVTDADARAQHVNNIAQAEAVDMNGNSVAEYSNLVKIPCGFPDNDDDGNPDDPFGILIGLEVTKEVESLPLNGFYYTNGETIAYRITYINSGEMPLTDVIIYDTLSGMSEVGSSELLNPGESRQCFVNYTVTKEDVARGYVSNVAIGQFIINGFVNTVYSDVVMVDTDGMENEWYVYDPSSPDNKWSYDSVTGWEDTTDSTEGDDTPDGKLPPFGIIDTDKLADGKAFCVRTITARDNASAAYEVDFCFAHASAQSLVMMMNRVGATPEVQLQVAMYASALWRTEVDKLYQEMITAADQAAQAVILNEYVCFTSFVANYEALLKALNPDQPALVAKKIASMWQDKCVTLCVEAHTPASERKDSFLSVAAGTGAVCDACTCRITGEEAGKQASSLSFCAQHAFPFSMTDMFLSGQDTAESWKKVRQIWSVEINNVHNLLCEKLGEHMQLAMLENTMFNQWLKVRESELIALYPDHPELVCQTMVKILMEHVNDLCSLCE